MTRGIQGHFSEAELEAVRAATRRAEAASAGEIVCFVAERCDRYEEGVWKAALLGAVVAAVAAAAWHRVLGAWGGELWIALPPLVGAVLWGGAALAAGALRLRFAGSDVVAERVDGRAAQAFLDEGVFATRDRTGILVFLALFERRVRILPDVGVRERVPDREWEEVARNLARGLRERRAGPALIEAVEACGRVLAAHGLPPRSDDTDELADGVRSGAPRA